MNIIHRRLRLLAQTSGRLVRVGRSPGAIRDSFAVALSKSGGQGPLILEWPHRGEVSKNWGDALNPELVRLISGRRAVPRAEVLNFFGRPVHYMIGSALGGVLDHRSVVWGTGFIRYDQVPLVRPAKIAAVRGKLSRQKYVEAGIPCPELFGDAALLYPRFFDPPVERKFKLGLIPHFRERDAPVFSRLGAREDVLVIDITDDLHSVIEQAKSCEMIASSSLHGLILADAYGIPSSWIRVTEKPKGDLFKFHDYLSTTNSNRPNPLQLSGSSTFEQLVDSVENRDSDVNLDELLRACPFL